MSSPSAHLGGFPLPLSATGLDSLVGLVPARVLCVGHISDAERGEQHKRGDQFPYHFVGLLEKYGQSQG
jgi:hypothetical protein